MARSGENKKPFCNKKLVVQGPSRMPGPTEYAVIFHGKRLIFLHDNRSFSGRRGRRPPTKVVLNRSRRRFYISKKIWTRDVFDFS